MERQLSKGLLVAKVPPLLQTHFITKKILKFLFKHLSVKHWIQTSYQKLLKKMVFSWPKNSTVQLTIFFSLDEYFLSHVQAIDDVCSRKKSRFFSKVKWDANVVKCVETFPTFTVTPQNNIGDLRCRVS